ncbi:MAG: hypothetical protein ABIY70_09495 [Capsulimonas sp.]|uniref:hypothetical protein n=1 Tax=Capsulimonas sp. TaxID=2494211 RepID=UPI0032658033
MLRNFRFAHAAAVAALLGLSVTASAPVHAGAYTYNTQERQINAGVLILQDAYSTVTPKPDLPNYDPYPFYILNQRTDVKPAGWSIVNPMAPKIVTADILATWNPVTQQIPGDPYGIGSGKSAYTLGAPVTQNMAAYWEVRVNSSTSADDLRQFDILLLNIRQDPSLSTTTQTGIRFTAQQKELLRQYVDGGGQLLIEAPTAANKIEDLFFPVAFTGGNFTGANLPEVDTNVLFRHPILSEPNILAQNELISLGHSAEFGAGQIGRALSIFDASVTDPYGLLSDVLYSGGTDAVIKAGQLGAGEVIVDTTASTHSINGFLGGSDVTGNFAPPNAYIAPNSGPYCNSSAGGAIASGVSSAFTRAPIADMKFLVNVMSWAGVHSSENGGSHQNSASTDVMASSVTPTWSAVGGGIAPPSVTSAPFYIAGSPGSAIFGHYVASVDKGGIVHVYDLIPGEDLDANGNPDDGKIADYQNGSSCDELWNTSVGPFASAPTIATPPGKQPQVFVELANGSVKAFNLVTGDPAAIPTPIAGTSPLYGSGGAPVPGYAPAPTYYGGKLYAGRADGTVAVYDYAKNYTWAFSLQPGLTPANAVANQAVTAPPAVALNGANGQAYSNDLILYVSTNRFIYTVFLGAFNETLTSNGGGYPTKLVNMSPTGNIEDTLPATGISRTFDILNGYEVPGGAGGPSGNQFTGVGSSTIGADYFAVPAGGSGQAVVRTVVGASDQSKAFGIGSPPTGDFSAFVSAPAIDKNGYAYVTVTDPLIGNSAIECIQDGLTIADRRVRWRFRLPSAGDAGTVDADGIDYSPRLMDMHFIGAPVLDRNGRVYALAVDNTAGGNRAAVLCFDTNQLVTANIFGTGGVATGTVASYTITQPRADNLSEFGTPSVVPLIQGLQFNTPRNGYVEFSNFAVPGSGGAGIYPNLSEPQPVQISYTLYDGTNNVPVGPVSVPVSTNMKWCVYQTTNAPVSAGLTLVGDYIFFADTSGLVYRVGVQISPSLVNANFRFLDGAAPGSKDQHRKQLWEKQATGLSVIDSIPASGSGSLILNGYDTAGGQIFPGTIALQNKKTVVLDADRLSEFDADGDLVWSVDSTTKSTVAGGYLDTTGTGALPGATGKVVVTHSDFNHPASVTQLNQNNFLIADTGNNRCVEIDRTGKVVWELTSFRDPNGVLANSGQPTTLNHPTSIRGRSYYDATNHITTVTYLIADTGNHRIIEISDAFLNGVAATTNNHRLRWVSHTYDTLARKYNYVSADYLFAPDGSQYIVGLIGNYRVGQFGSSVLGAATLPVGTQPPASADTPGGSIVMLDYTAPGATAAAGTASGFIHVDQFGSGASADYRLRTYSDFGAYLQTSVGDRNKYDVDTAAKAVAGNTLGQGTNNAISLTRPRFLQTYVTSVAGTPVLNFLVTDADGAFDLRLVDTVGGHGGSLGFYRPVAQWGFTNVDYNQMMTPVKRGDVSFERTNIPFSATSLQITGHDRITIGVTPCIIGEYLISAATPQGDTGSAMGDPNFTIGEELPPTSKTPPRIGGEVFQIKYGSIYRGGKNPPSIPYDNSYWNAGLPTISRPTNGAALVQPTGALTPL